MKIKILKTNKSIPADLEFELPPFTVLTGKNGSGKTHLFEALANRDITEIIVNDKLLKSRKYIPFGALTPHIDDQCTPAKAIQLAQSIWNHVQQAQAKFSRSHQNLATTSPEQDSIYTHINSQEIKDTVLRISRQSGVMPSQLTEDIIINNIHPRDVASKNLFDTSFALAFKYYHLRHIDNKLNGIYEDDGTPHSGVFLNDKEFKLKYGKPPWILVNSILEKLSLPYKVNDPMGTTRESTYHFKLLHRSSNVEIGTNELSTGEKTLMSLALAMYNFTGSGNHTEIIILDEPDASLHPSMSKLMLEIIEEEIVQKQGIPVIISTHSLTTIACAPASSLYKISSHQKCPEQCNLQDSTRILSYGISNLRVSTEHRRQVFVEHNYDVIYYEYLFDIISRKKKLPTTPHFLPPHNLNGSNCGAVLEITRKLRNMGNTQVFGLIDWDKKNNPEQQIIILGMGKRYSIENYIFEPHFLGLYLILKKFVNPADFGLDNCNSYIDVRDMIKDNEQTLQNIVNYVESSINWENNNDSVSESRLIDGTIIKIRSEILTIQGHKFEDLCKITWPKLNSIRENNNSDYALKKDIISTVINDYPGLISIDLLKTFEEIK